MRDKNYLKTIDEKPNANHLYDCVFTVFNTYLRLPFSCTKYFLCAFFLYIFQKYFSIKFIFRLNSLPDIHYKMFKHVLFCLNVFFFLNPWIKLKYLCVVLVLNCDEFYYLYIFIYLLLVHIFFLWSFFTGFNAFGTWNEKIF